MQETLRKNVAALADRHRREAAAAPVPTRIASRITGFFGSMAFVLLHCVVYSL